jgi:hypothetical protein
MLTELDYQGTKQAPVPNAAKKLWGKHEGWKTK